MIAIEQTIPQRAASEPITIRTAKVSEIDALANAMDRSRNYIVNQAIEQYLEANTWQMERIKSGISTSPIALLSWATLENLIQKRYM
jgi:metal-responsive CopG/Arc/MetJ family transcriptional regulator